MYHVGGHGQCKREGDETNHCRMFEKEVMEEYTMEG